jgi:magnesium-transporting ATPase (P-type)
MPQEDNVCFHDPDLFRNLGNANSENYSDLRRVMFFLAICHTIVIDSKKNSYNSSSPDELALVNFAKQFGFEFSARDADDNLTISEFNT